MRIVHVNALHCALFLQLVRRLSRRITDMFSVFDLLLLVRVVSGGSVCSHDGRDVLG
jgi:hypothetical protein